MLERDRGAMRRRAREEEWIGGYLPEKSTPNSFTAVRIYRGLPASPAIPPSLPLSLPLARRRVYALNCKRARLTPRGVLSGAVSS